MTQPAPVSAAHPRKEERRKERDKWRTTFAPPPLQRTAQHTFLKQPETTVKTWSSAGIRHFTHTWVVYQPVCVLNKIESLSHLGQYTLCLKCSI